MKNKVKSRLFEHIITTIIGTLMMCGACLYLWFNLKTLGFENIAIAAFLGVIGLMFLGSKDSWIKKIFEIFTGRIGQK